MQTLTYLKSRRLWVVRDVQVWGLASDAQFFYLGVENVQSTARLMFGISSIGETAQDIQFSSLIDHRGNNLPEAINNPRVLIRQRTPFNVYLVGEESNSGFRVVRDPAAPGPVSADFFIYETGF
jgi:hypothetical protein